MSASSAEITPPKDPAAYRRGRGAGRLGVAAFGLACAIGGAVLATLAPQVLPRRLPPALVETAPPSASAIAPQPAPASVQPSPPAVAEGDVRRLDERLSALETREDRTARAAASVLAAAVLLEATQQSGPFAEELAALRASAPSAPELTALAQLAQAGAPSRAALAESFADYAARAASASRAPGDKAGLSARVAYILSRVVSVRRVAETRGDGPDAILAGAERQLDDGDLDGALRTLDRLAPAAREAMAPWRARAERRAEIDHAAAALRARALRDLTAAAGSAG